MPELRLCPLCKGWIPNNDNPGLYRGAISRKDNKTEICSACGVLEAREAMEAHAEAVTKEALKRIEALEKLKNSSQS